MCFGRECQLHLAPLPSKLVPPCTRGDFRGVRSASATRVSSTTKSLRRDSSQSRSFGNRSSPTTPGKISGRSSQSQPHHDLTRHSPDGGDPLAYAIATGRSTISSRLRSQYIFFPSRYARVAIIAPTECQKPVSICPLVFGLRARKQSIQLLR